MKLPQIFLTRYYHVCCWTMMLVVSTSHTAPLPFHAVQLFFNWLVHLCYFSMLSLQLCIIAIPFHHETIYSPKPPLEGAHIIFLYNPADFSNGHPSFFLHHATVHTESSIYTVLITHVSVSMQPNCSKF